MFERLGGATALLEWVQENPKHKALFYGWIVKLLPKEPGIKATSEQLSPRDSAIRAARALIELEVSEQERSRLVTEQEPISHAADTTNSPQAGRVVQGGATDSGAGDPEVRGANEGDRAEGGREPA